MYSPTAALAMGDALAVALLSARGFTQEDFARSHPGGSLGRRLLLRVEDLMHTGDRTPMVREGVSLSEALMEMTRKGLGMTTIVDPSGRIEGVFTDGDLRRALLGSRRHTEAIVAGLERNGYFDARPSGGRAGGGGVHHPGRPGAPQGPPRPPLRGAAGGV